MTNNDDESSVNEKNIKIFVRILPLENFCESCAKIDGERKKIYIRCLQEMQPNRIAISKSPSYWCFHMDAIFCDSSQEEVYRVSTEDLVSKILGGVSCVLMGYGQTGSGKSFTITGFRNNWEHRGLVARLLSHMFTEKSSRKKTNKIEYRVSFVELYGKEVKDLLVSDVDTKLRINDREPFKNITVVCIANEKEGLKKIFEGEVRRSIAKDSTYPASHLATAVITFHVSNTSLISSWGVVTTAKIHIVEVAGTGTLGRDNYWKTAMDVGTANLTKTQLERFFSCTGNSRTSVVSIIRSSNLLKILGSAFSVSSVIRFISHIRITKEDLNMTLSTLRFASRIASLKPVRIKEDVRYRSDLIEQKLQDEVNVLEKELILNEIFLGQESLVNMSKSRMEQINRSILNFLNGKISDFTLLNVSQAQMLLKNMKNLYNRLIVKTVEVEKLKDTYESLIKDVSDISIEESLPKSSSQTRLGTQEAEKETEKEVGTLDKSKGGVTLGPYTEEVESEKAPNDYAATSEQVVKIDNQNMHTVLQLFDRFLKEETGYAKIKATFDQIDKTLTTVHQRFSNTINSYFLAKRNLDDAHDKLNKYQRIQYVLELEDQRGNEVNFEMKRTIERDITCHKKVLLNLEEELNQIQHEISMLSDRRFEMSLKLESGFREYCKKKNILLHYVEKSMKILMKPDDKRESLEIIRRKYNKLQRAMLRKTKETGNLNEILKYMRCNSANV